MSASAEQVWTSEQLDVARRMKAQKRSFREIGEAIGRSATSVRHKLGAKPENAKWTAKQIRYLADNIDKLDDELAEEISKLGPPRTSQAVRTKRRNLKPLDPIKPRAPRGEMLWPVLKGTAEDRDAQFVRLVQAEALRLGLGRKVAA